eukprot:3318175-Lingulodinium_polyedra.AAC.1
MDDYIPKWGGESAPLRVYERRIQILACSAMIDPTGASRRAIVGAPRRGRVRQDRGPRPDIPLPSGR